MALVEMTCVEDSLENPPGVDAAGMPVSRFRAYKAGTRSRTRVLYYTSERGRDGALMLAEAAVFGYRTLGILETAMQMNHRLDSPEAMATLDYLIRNEQLFLDREPWNQAAVIRHHESMLLNPWPSALSPYVMELMLFENHLPFALLSGHPLEADVLKAEFDLVLLPDTRCLNDAQAHELTRYVHSGGSLLVVGDSGTATALNQCRSRWAFFDLFGVSLPHRVTTTYEETAGALRTSDESDASAAMRVRHGKGEAAYLPGIEFALPDRAGLTRFSGYDWFYHPYWRPPKNAPRLMETVTALLESRRRIETDLPRHVGMEFYRILEGWRIQFLNYAHPAPVPEHELTIRLGRQAASNAHAVWHAPEADRIPTVNQSDDGTLHVTTPSFALLGTLDIRRGMPGK